MADGATRGVSFPFFQQLSCSHFLGVKIVPCDFLSAHYDYIAVVEHVVSMK